MAGAGGMKVSPVCWRVGRSVGRTIYLQQGDEPSEHDPLIGVMDTPGLAKLVVNSVNEQLVMNPKKVSKDAI